MQVYSQKTHQANAGATINAAIPEIDALCHEIKAACAGFGTDEARLSKVLGERTADERYLISIRYPQIYQKTLISEIKSETSGDYGRLCQLLSQSLEDAEAQIIREACKGSGTNENLLYPVLGGRTREELDILKKAFFKAYQNDLVVVIADDVGGDLKKHYLAVLNAMSQPYNPSIHNQQKAEELADIIYKAGEGKWGTDESTFCNTLWSIPPEFIRAVDAAYVAKHKSSLRKAIEKEFTGDSETAMVYHLDMLLDPINTIAVQIEKTMKGLGTDEYGLACAIVRYQSVLKDVGRAYKAKYNTDLRARIVGETSGDYRKLLTVLLDKFLS
jgi:hypothetical protein